MADKTPNPKRSKAQMEARADVPEWYGLGPKGLAAMKKYQAEQAAKNKED